MNKKIVFLGLLVSGAATAADFVGNVSFTLLTPITATEDNALSLGNIIAKSGDSCTVAPGSSTATGAACSAGGTVSSASFTVSGETGTSVNVAISGEDTSITDVTFTPDIGGVNSLSLGGTGSATLEVGGTVNITGASAPNGTQSLTYTLTLTY
ncbi:DUF4402 domain-containing protein [Paraferrimonas sp. SM1919]|uniref:DUF4402 domain-containing protein n=1 Tax=Paraferrimonas sp. SM1919 TaxID=2662263 RepID=UPI0013D41833|nr:DUF4402 domain-containing protein [Paraferrimonas sp. SM1919]